MPMHDWTEEDSGRWYHVQGNWIGHLANALNGGILPTDYYAVPVLKHAQYGPCDFTPRVVIDTSLKRRPAMKYVAKTTDDDYYLRKRMRLAIRIGNNDQTLSSTVAMIEIVSPGIKKTQWAFRDFLKGVYHLLKQGIHLLIVDPFPPSSRDPRGIHAAIWDGFDDTPFVPPADKNLTLVSYECEFAKRAYIEPFAVGDRLPEMPVFLKVNGCVMAPLEATYQMALEGNESLFQSQLRATGKPNS